MSYHRMHEEEVLKSSTRSIMVKLAKERVYTTVSELEEELSLSKSAVLWHLGLLEARGKLKSRVIAGKRIYYLPEMEFEAILCYLMAYHVRRKIVKLVLKGMRSISSIALELKMSKSTVHRHVSYLLSYGVLKRKRGELLVSKRANVKLPMLLSSRYWSARGLQR
ncbi:MAG: hypothetical protein DRN96_09390 [Thermoproteota archaeon]|nr:MAG: hypothetical protein DRN96_09390 [Candidatus Korarchaeota archaeon]